jgi:hypothetical protein
MIMHKELASGKWFTLSLVEQLANIGSDVERTIRWRKKGNKEYSNQAFDRALELLYLTISDPKNQKRLKEILRIKECLIDHYCFNNEYGNNDETWQKYFNDFTYAAALKRRR